MTVRDGDETRESVLTVHELPEVGTFIVTPVPVVARDADAEGVETVRHCAPNARDENRVMPIITTTKIAKTGAYLPFTTFVPVS